MLPILPIQNELRLLSHPEKAKAALRFFKTGPGQYGEGDQFLGVSVPRVRTLVRKYQGLSFSEIQVLLDSIFNEERLLGLLILVSQFEEGAPSHNDKVHRFYLKNLKAVNNWNLVDGSAPALVGGPLFQGDRSLLFNFAHSTHLWTRRIAIVSTYYFIRKNDFQTTLELSEILLKDTEDLIHKAVGWMLREVGKRNENLLEKFLLKYSMGMPRVMLRYAIEKFPEDLRKKWLRG